MPNTNKEFEWTDELVKEFVSNCLTRDIDKHIEAFKESKQSEYEILSFIRKDTSSLYKDESPILKVTVIPSIYKIEDYLVVNSAFKIHSVKRISDNEVFTVGDKLQKMTKENTIVSIWHDFNNNDIWLSTNDKMQYGCSLDTAIKNKLDG